MLLNEALEKITSYGPVQIELLTDDTEKTKNFMNQKLTTTNSQKRGLPYE
ncbi:hypothetical protein EfmJHP36_13530 [Enterococcus faecium]|nr:hypothetical protein EfmJHP36_13530 [Enterococcus faecium]